MQADTNEWNNLLSQHASLTKAEHDRLVVLRRRAKSCLYAEKSRNKQLTQLQEAQRENTELRDENADLRAQAETLHARVRRLTALLEQAGTTVPDLDAMLTDSI